MPRAVLADPNGLWWWPKVTEAARPPGRGVEPRATNLRVPHYSPTTYTHYTHTRAHRYPTHRYRRLSSHTQQNSATACARVAYGWTKGANELRQQENCAA